MKPSQDGSWLKQPISSLQLSGELVTQATLHGFSTVEELLNIPITQLEDIAWLNDSMLDELLVLIKKYIGRGQE